jgi:riboflavin kinase/FMN adenylyltransferase
MRENNTIITGKVVSGNKIGRTLGAPTANLLAPADCTAADGVYAVVVQVDGAEFNGVANLGDRPSVEEAVKRRWLEVFIFDFDRDIYDKTVTVTLLQRLRGEITFASLDELHANIDQDIRRAKEYFNIK